MTPPHRYEQLINGRRVHIEVACIAADRWRAQLVRPDVGPSAMMPFYGRTPDEAAEMLSHWLTLAHRQTVASG